MRRVTVRGHARRLNCWTLGGLDLLRLPRQFVGQLRPVLRKPDVVAAHFAVGHSREILSLVGQGATLADTVLDRHPDKFVGSKIHEWDLFHGLPPHDCQRN